MNQPHQPGCIIPHMHTAIVNPTGAARDAAQKSAIDSFQCGSGETWYIVPDARLSEIEAAGRVNEYAEPAA